MRKGLLILAAVAVAACSAAPVPDVGVACNDDGKAVCDPTATRMLQCTHGVWLLYSDCRGPDACAQTGATISCDTSGNSVGDSCPPTSEGKVRCDPDGGINFLRCIDGGLVIIDTCPQPLKCGFRPDAGLSCW
jgi:hypothetical protein